MNYLVISLAAQMLATSLWAGETDDQVVKVLKTSTEKTALIVTDA